MKQINVSELIKNKKPQLYKRLPNFAVKYLERVIHQEEVNRIIRENEHLKSQAFCDDLIKRFDLEVNVTGMEDVPKSGGVILASNHPLGGMDAIALVHKFGYYRSDIKFIVNDILMYLDNLSELFVGVNKVGKSNAIALQSVGSLFESDQVIAVFPAGLVSRKQGSIVQDLPWQKTFVTRARKNNLPIVPVHISGRLSPFFYRLANVRKFLKIKANIEMLYLVDEFFKLKNQRIDITFGTPIYIKDFDNSMSDYIIANKIKDICYNLKK